MSDSAYPRDLSGYGAQPPHARWPDQARIAVQFVLNYEEGGESSILHGDAAAEAFLSDMIGAQAVPGMRHLSMESHYEYGSRAGFWRLHRLFTERQLPITVYGVASAMARNPAAVEAMLKAGWEIASHGYRWINYQHVPIEVEREHIARAIEIHRQLTGTRPSGWYQGRTSPNTARLIVEAGGFVYDADSYADDLPYYDTRYGRPQLIVPYSLETNDMRFVAAQGFHTGEQFFSYLKDSFDALYEEGMTRPKMLSIGLHARIVGRPGRSGALARFIDYVQRQPQVWIAQRIEIAQHWLATHPHQSTVA